MEDTIEVRMHQNRPTYDTSAGAEPSGTAHVSNTEALENHGTNSSIDSSMVMNGEAATSRMPPLAPAPSTPMPQISPAARGHSSMNGADRPSVKNVLLAPKGIILPTQTLITEGVSPLPVTMNNHALNDRTNSSPDKALWDANGLDKTQSPGMTQQRDTSSPPGSNSAVATGIMLDGGRSSGKYRRSYILPDGTFAQNGKGLGRGRPGIKRGPRKSKSDGDSAGSPQAVSSPALSHPPSSRNSLKRKRAGSDASSVHSTSVSSYDSRESTPEYQPTTTQTRSGRQTQRPIEISTAQAPSTSPTVKRTNSTTQTTPTVKAHPKIKRKVYRGREQFALCEHCLRGFGPTHNVIVFCDACNKCWHQKCHAPQIPAEVVQNSKAEWFCATCDKILHGNKRTKKSVGGKRNIILAPPPPPLFPPPALPRYGPPLVGAQALTLEQRRAYLYSLSKDQLVNLALRAGDLAPTMPIFETSLAVTAPIQQSRPQFTSDYVTPVDNRPGLDQNGSNEITDEGYDDHFDEHAALYPRAGDGIQLPPEQVDMHMLLEGPESKSFSHWVRGMPMKAHNDNVSLVFG